ncbi:MAG: FAD:protein FMN transferase [Labilibaculum sp.]|nr:FAD:protein FMN transferase [Labilibaculum sp.]MBI9056513.1 FAD:protein FMN transferase [Labilibaculum sp.]
MRIRFNFVLLIAIVVFTSCQNNSKKYYFDEGPIFGTFYHIVYEHSNDANLHDEIIAKMVEFDLSLSTYKPHSVISKVNNNDSTVVLDEYFLKVMKRADEISKVTNGAFDMTVAPLVNAWGFGFKNKLDPEMIPVDSLLEVVGYTKVQLEAGKVIKSDPRIMFDASAIAKGYGVDVVADFLESKEIMNYMVEIGGEIRAKGKNNKGRIWRVGIDKPIDDPSTMSREIQDVIQLENSALATSGNYRQFYIKDGKKYAHTIDPRIGYPVQHSLLSATVVAPDCMSADAYATSFMVMGLEESIAIVENDSLLEAYFIYTDSVGNYKTYRSEKIKDLIVK